MTSRLDPGTIGTALVRGRCAIIFGAVLPLVCAASASAQIKPQISPWIIPDRADCSRFFLYRPSEVRQRTSARPEPRDIKEISPPPQTPDRPTEKVLAECLDLLSHAIDMAEVDAAKKVIAASTKPAESSGAATPAEKSGAATAPTPTLTPPTDQDTTSPLRRFTCPIGMRGAG